MYLAVHSFEGDDVVAILLFFFFFQAEDGIRDADVTGVQTCALPIYSPLPPRAFRRPAFASSILATRSASPALTAAKKSCVSLTGFSSAVKLRTKEAGSVLSYPDLADRPGLSQWSRYRRSFAGAPRFCNDSNMAFESFRNCPWALSQTPSRRKGTIVAAAQALACPVTFSSGSQRNSCMEMKNAKAEPAAKAISSARTCHNVAPATRTRWRPVIR